MRSPTSQQAQLWIQVLVTLTITLLLASRGSAGVLREMLERGDRLQVDEGDIEPFLTDDVEETYTRVRKAFANRQPRVMCGPGKPDVDCGDGLMGVWLRLMKNPDYSE